jgi:hypothetical protein
VPRRIGRGERFGDFGIGSDGSVDPSALRARRSDGETIVDISEDIAVDMSIGGGGGMGKGM